MTDEQNTTSDDKHLLRDLLPAYSFGMTDPDETRHVEALLSTHPEWAAELQAELNDYEMLADGLLQSAPAVAPPPALHGRILAAAQQKQNRRPSIRTTRGVMLGMAAAMIAILALNVTLLLQVADLESETDALRSQLDNQSNFLLRYAREDYVEFNVADTRVDAGVELAQDEETRGFLRCNPESHVAVLEVENLPPISNENAYQVWLIQGDQRISGGLIVIRGDGDGTLVIHAPEPLGNYSYIGITREPATGSDAPTTDPVARGSLYNS